MRADRRTRQTARDSSTQQCRGSFDNYVTIRDVVPFVTRLTPEADVSRRRTGSRSRVSAGRRTLLDVRVGDPLDLESGIASGCSLERYCPNNKVTRGQMAVFLDARWIYHPPVTTTSMTTRDAPSRAPSTAFARAGIAFGCTASTYCPDMSVSRGQMAAFLDRALDLPPPTRTSSPTTGRTSKAGE